MTQKIIKFSLNQRVIVLGILLLISVLISINHFIIHFNSNSIVAYKNDGIYGVQNLYEMYDKIEHYTGDYIGNIYMDWTVHSDKFGYLNYKSLESLIRAYPDSNIVVLHLGPTAADYYKFGNMLSKHIFQKYVKFGKNVVVDIQGFGKLLRKDVIYGYKYWTKEIEKCCNHKSHKDIQEAKNRYLPPLHLFFFHRILNLYKSGGIFSDFSFMHIMFNPNMLKVKHGYVVITNCDESETSTDCTTSMLLKFEKQSNVLHCMLAQYDDTSFHHYDNSMKNGLTTNTTFLSCLENSLNGGINCILSLLDSCFNSTSTKNDMMLQIFKLDKDISGFNTFPDNYNYLHNLNQKFSLNTSSILWFGESSFKGYWDINLDLKIITNNMLQENILEQYNFLKKSNNIIEGCDIRLPSCSHYSSEISHNYKYSNQESHQANKSCAISFVVAGFMKAGSSYMYNLLTLHPQIVKLLRGVAFKESGCYLPDSMRGKKSPARMNCFPFVENGEYFIYGDATVNYALRKEVPYYLHQDNPNIKAIFILRDPISRTISHHKFSYGGFTRELKGMSDINEIIAYALDPIQPDGLMTLYTLAVDAVYDIQHNNVGFNNSKAIKNLMNQYQRGLQGENTRKYRIAANLVIHSIYFNAIYHWIEVIGKSNVFVISGEVLNPVTVSNSTTNTKYDKSANDKNLNYHMSNIFRFIGLCPRKPFVNSGNIDTHLTYSYLANYIQMNTTTVSNLKAFYKPFNTLLQYLVKDMTTNAFIRNYNY